MSAVIGLSGSTSSPMAIRRTLYTNWLVSWGRQSASTWLNCDRGHDESKDDCDFYYSSYVGRLWRMGEARSRQ